MLQMDIELRNMITVKGIQDIDFGNIRYYSFKDDLIFYALNNTSLITRELSKITSILEKEKIKYKVDEKYNIKVIAS